MGVQVANQCHLSNQPQKSPLEKGNKGGCFQSNNLNLMTLVCKPEPAMCIFNLYYYPSNPCFSASFSKCTTVRH
ncbi:hypothetical protein KsCSTR_01880 [Candidatus Kuenenia stuttgartiensis]|uniref:Uncharacterized protein n=1 Tax=Kuenenia stuttgartiensis TaxID=174633 RepID=Q1PUW2_KUEST|nr:hypothetical protein KsCSTR_01880 [Candidatus Kuenenia stuttgartiensis]CAJ71015.1 unknown protein [Candidatus Kuenenia stuttgartiensis]